MRNRPRKRPGGSLPFKRGPRLGPEHNRWFWNPNRVGAYPLDDWRILRSLREVDPTGDISINWNPVTSRWQVWMRARNFHNPICSGWKLLFVVELEGQYVPVDERTLARLYERSGRRYGNLWEYWLKVEQAMDREKAQSDREHAQHMSDGAGEYFDYTTIKVGYGPSNGSKFSRFHSGD